MLSFKKFIRPNEFVRTSLQELYGKGSLDKIINKIRKNQKKLNSKLHNAYTGQRAEFLDDYDAGSGIKPPYYLGKFKKYGSKHNPSPVDIKRALRAKALNHAEYQANHLRYARNGLEPTYDSESTPHYASDKEQKKFRKVEIKNAKFEKDQKDYFSFFSKQKWRKNKPYPNE